MSAPGSPRQIGEANDLLDVAELDDVRYYESSAKRRVDGAEGSDDATFRVAVRHEDEELEVRCRVTVESDEAVFVADAGALYRLSELVEVSPDAMEAFVSRVGVLAVYPYLREALSQGAGRLVVPCPLLPILRPGVSLEQDDAAGFEE